MTESLAVPLASGTHDGTTLVGSMSCLVAGGADDRPALVGRVSRLVTVGTLDVLGACIDLVLEGSTRSASIADVISVTVLVADTTTNLGTVVELVMKTVLICLVTKSACRAILGNVTWSLTELADTLVTSEVIVSISATVRTCCRARGVNVSLLPTELANDRGTSIDGMTLFLAPGARLDVRLVDLHHLDVTLGLGVPGNI